jgi:hypothetical protein
MQSTPYLVLGFICIPSVRVLPNAPLSIAMHHLANTLGVRFAREAEPLEKQSIDISDAFWP